MSGSRDYGCLDCHSIVVQKHSVSVAILPGRVDFSFLRSLLQGLERKQQEELVARTLQRCFLCTGFVPFLKGREAGRENLRFTITFTHVQKDGIELFFFSTGD